MNRNSIPFDPNGPWYTSGIRMGTPALTTLGMKEKEMKLVASLIVNLLKHTKPDEKSRAKAHIDPATLEHTRKHVTTLLEQFPLYPELVLSPSASFALA